MKTYKNLYSQICSSENLVPGLPAGPARQARGEAVAEFEFNLEGNLLRLQAALHTQTYQPGSYHNFYIFEPKRRLVSAAPFRDRVVHHALCKVIEPIWRRVLSTTLCLPVGKGTHAALDLCQAWVRQYRYAFHGDVVKYFPSIDHQILKTLLSRRIADAPAIGLTNRIIDSGADIQVGESPQTLFPAMIYLPCCARGLPIGNLTSQFWANVYLHELDIYVKHELKCAAYLRYMDDVVLFSNEKSQLHTWKAAIGEFLGARLRLLLHPRKSVVFPTGIGIDYCGFILFPTHRRLRRNVTDLTPQPPSRNGKGGHHPPLSWSHLTTLGNKVSQNGKGEEAPLSPRFGERKRVGVLREV